MTDDLPPKGAFEAQVGSLMSARWQDAAEPLRLTLSEVVDGRCVAPVEQFSVFFVGPPDGPVEQGIVRVEHAELGTMDLFLVPLERTGDGVRYEAAFSRLTDGQV